MISIPDIHSRIKNIEQDLVMGPDQLKERILFAYCNKSLHDIKNLLNEDSSPEALIPSFEKLLKLNWQFINGSLLSYTALPNHNITKLFCDIALFIAQYKNQSLAPTDTPAGLIELLMPTVAVKFCRDGYPDLISSWDKDHNQWHYVDIEKILKTHILSTDGKYLIPIKVITELDPYTPQKLYNPYLNHLEDNSGTDILNEEELKRLKEHSKITTAVFTSFEAYTDSMNGKQHLLGQLNVLLWHLRFNSINGIGKEEIAGEGTYIAIHNFMKVYEKFSPEKIDQIPEPVKKELQLLIAHAEGNTKTLQIMKSESIDSCIATRSNALLSAICDHEAALSEITLSEQAEESFLKERKENFDQTIKDVVHFIDHKQELDCSDKLGVNRTVLSTLNIDFKITCLEDFGLISASEMQVLFDTDDKIESVISLFTCINDFTLFLMNNPDDIVKVFLEKFGVKLWMKQLGIYDSDVNDSDADDSDSDVDDMDEDDCVKLKNFIQILKLLDSRKRILFIEALFDKYIEIYKHKHFQELIYRIYDDLDYPEDIQLLTQLIDKLVATITTPAQLGSFLYANQPLQSKRRNAVAIQNKLLEMNIAIQNKLLALILTPKDLELFQCPNSFDMANFQPNLQKTIQQICAKMLMENPQEIAEIIKKRKYFASNALEWFDAKQRSQILPLLVQELSNWDHPYLCRLLKLLNFEEQAYIFRMSKSSLSKCIKSGLDLYQFLTYLDSSGCELVLKEIEARLPILIKEPKEVFYLNNFLQGINREFLLNAPTLRKVCASVLMKDQQEIAQRIEEDWSNIVVFDWLNFSERTDIIKKLNLDAIKQNIRCESESPYLDVKKLALVLFYLDANGCKAVLEMLENILPHLITTQKDIAEIKNGFNQFNTEYLNLFLTERKEKFDQAIKDAECFIDETQEPDYNDKLEINYIVLSRQHIDFKIKTLADFGLISASEIQMLFDTEDKIEFVISLFTSIDDFKWFLINNPDDKVKVFLEKFGVKLWMKWYKISNYYNVGPKTFIEILRELDDKKRMLFIEALFDKHIEIYKHKHFQDLIESICTLTCPENMQILTQLIDKLFAVITTPAQLGSFLSMTNHSIAIPVVVHTKLLEMNIAIQNKLLALILTPKDLDLFQRPNNFDMANFQPSLQKSIQQICAKMLVENPEEIAEIIKKESYQEVRYYDGIYLLEWFDARQRSQILPLLIQDLSSWNIYRLLRLLSLLNFKEKHDIFKALKSNLTDKIENGVDLYLFLKHLDSVGCELVLKEIEARLPVLIKKPEEVFSLNNILQKVKRESLLPVATLQKVCASVLMKNQRKIAQRIEEDWGNIVVFDWLNFSERTDIIKKLRLDAIKPNMRYLDAEKLALVLSYLDANGCKAVLEILEDILPDLITTQKDIAEIEKNGFNHLNAQYLKPFLVRQFPNLYPAPSPIDENEYPRSEAREMISHHSQYSLMALKSIPGPSTMAPKTMPNKDEIASIRTVCSIPSPSFFGSEISLDGSDSEGEESGKEEDFRKRKRGEKDEKDEREHEKRLRKA